MSGAPTVISNRVGRVRVVFKYLYEAGYLDRPVRYGTEFAKPSVAVLGKHRASKPKKLFTPEQVHLLLANATPRMRGMIWLGLFAGFGNNDCATVKVSHMCLETGWVTYSRPKTGLQRRAWLPPEAGEALRAVWPDSDHVFRTQRGNTWTTGNTANPISTEFPKLTKRVGVGQSFYALRHTIETIGGRPKDQVAVDFIMGHVSPGMSSVYREEIEDDRLRAVGDVIYAWLGKPSASGCPLNTQASRTPNVSTPPS